VHKLLVIVGGGCEVRAPAQGAPAEEVYQEGEEGTWKVRKRRSPESPRGPEAVGAEGRVELELDDVEQEEADAAMTDVRASSSQRMLSLSRRRRALVAETWVRMMTAE